MDIVHFDKHKNIQVNYKENVLSRLVARDKKKKKLAEPKSSDF